MAIKVFEKGKVKMIFKQKMQIVGTVISIGIALTGALSASERIRLVDILTLFFGGFGAGVSLVSLIKSLKENNTDSKNP